MSLRYDEIADILKIIDASSCDEVTIETGDVKLVVRRNGPAHAEQPSPAPLRVAGSPAASVSGTSGKSAHAPAPAAKTTPGQFEVTAPMIGIFYRAPSPADPPFVEVGSRVEPGQPLCLIEVMKLFTTITSEVAGRIAQINAQNGELVEYGGTLFVIDPL